MSVVVPDALILAAVAALAGILGFLSRTVMDLRTRVAVLEKSHDALEVIAAKLDQIRQEFAEFKGAINGRLK